MKLLSSARNWAMDGFCKLGYKDRLCRKFLRAKRVRLSTEYKKISVTLCLMTANNLLIWPSVSEGSYFFFINRRVDGC